MSSPWLPAGKRRRAGLWEGKQVVVKQAVCASWRAAGAVSGCNRGISAVHLQHHGRSNSAPPAVHRCTCGTVLFASGTFRDVRLHTQDVNCWDYDLFLSTTVPCPQPTAKVALVTGEGDSQPARLCRPHHTHYRIPQASCSSWDWGPARPGLVRPADLEPATL